jgi:ankyrin repeat protein
MNDKLNADFFSSMLNQRDPMTLLRTFISTGNADLVKPMLEKIDFLKYSADLLSIAITTGKIEIVELLFNKGADL